MKKTKILLSVIALVLVCVVSVMGTLALLTAQTNAVHNTFVAAGGTDGFVTSLSLTEYQVISNTNGDGSYTEYKTTEVAANTYSNVLPGVSLPKTVIVKTTDKNAAPAYLYIEIVNTLDKDVFDWDVTDNWLNQANANGLHGGTVYVYSTDKSTPAIITEDVNIVGVLEDNAIKVKDTNDLKLTDSTNSMDFYAYLAQTTVADEEGNNVSTAAGVYNICFKEEPTVDPNA